MSSSANAATTSGSNCVPEQRSSSARAAPIVSAERYGPLGGHRVERVADEHDPRDERDLRPGQAVGVARAVEVLAARAHDARDVGERRRAQQDPLGDHRVAADELPLLGGERAGLVEDRVRDRHLPDVVQLRRQPRARDLLVGQLELDRERLGELDDAGELLVRPRRAARRSP